jgi:hypothetical protein
MNHGAWWGTVVDASFCTFGGVVVWPRNVACPLQITACGGHTIPGDTIFYKYMSPVSQPTLCGSCRGHGTTHGCHSCGGFSWHDDGVSCVMAKHVVPSQIKLYPRNPVDVGKKVLLQGYAGGEWVRNTYGGVPIDGEYVTLALPFGISVAVFDPGALTAVQKDATAYNVLAYAFDPVTATEEPIADWQPDEVTPQYRVSRIPHLGHRNVNTGALNTGTINALVKLEHIDVALDTDWLILQNLPAIKYGMHARQLNEHDQAAAAVEMQNALVALNHELRTHDGDRTTTWFDLGMKRFRRDLDLFT